MPTLTVKFEGMALFVKANGRSEALLVDPVKAGSAHSHQHLAEANGRVVPMTDVLVWVESNGIPLQGPLGEIPPLLANLNEILPGEDLKPFLKTDAPETQQGWRSLLDAWVRLPGGKLSTTPTDTTGGEVKWVFPAQDGQQEIKRQLTQFCTVTRENVDGPVHLAVKSMSGGNVTKIPVPEAGGAFNIDLRTLFSGVPPPAGPNPGDTVKLQELELLFKCLKSEKMRVPSVVWPSPPPAGGTGIGTLTDPFTGICPDGIVAIGG